MNNSNIRSLTAHEISLVQGASSCEIEVVAGGATIGGGLGTFGGKAAGSYVGGMIGRVGGLGGIIFGAFAGSVIGRRWGGGLGSAFGGYVGRKIAPFMCR